MASVPAASPSFPVTPATPTPALPPRGLSPRDAARPTLISAISDAIRQTILLAIGLAPAAAVVGGVHLLGRLEGITTDTRDPAARS